MTQKTQHTDERGVSPVIGVILMVAITVILAAVIGTFVLGLGESVGETAPQAQFDFDYSDNPPDNTWVNITHEGGDPVDNSTIDIIISGNSVYTGSGGAVEVPFAEEIKAGNSTAINTTHTSGAVKIVWTSSSGDKSAVIADSEVA